MTKQYITDNKGRHVKIDGEKLFWLDSDGDRRPDTEQTVYREHNTPFGGNTKINKTYNPSKKEFNK
ncbi:MAG: hypothetical protein FD167_3383 [bacterium]|nr:MAG: hypothetical protein FD167_3383 [bacterium]